MKRFFDAIVATLALATLAPLMVAIALAVRLRLGAPVIFAQERPGRLGRPFRLLKFRTMREAYDASGRPLPDDDRVTGLGGLLRSTSLDELPEFWNVLCGDMSLVGPRPLLLQYLPLYSAEQMRRHEVRPGLTGWAQINGRNRIAWEQKFELDVWYVDHRSFWLDLKILVITMVKVLKLESISPEGSLSPPPFEGSRVDSPAGALPPIVPPSSAMVGR